MEGDKKYSGMSLSALLTDAGNLFRFLLRKWWIVGLVGLVFGIAGIVYAIIEKPKYKSTLTFALEDGDGGLGGALSLAAELGFNLSGSKNLFQGDNILTLLTSRTIVEKVLLDTDTINGKAISMADYYNYISKDSTKKKEDLSPKMLRLANVSFPAGLPREKFSYLQDSMLYVMYKNLAESGNLSASRPDKKLNYYEVSVVSPEERFTKIFTDKLITEAVSFYTQLRSQHSKEVLDILETRVAQTKGNLSSSITSRAELQDANVNPAFQQARAEMDKKQVDISAYGGAYAELYKNLELARYQYLKDIPLLQIIDPAEYPMTKIKSGKLKTGLLAAIAGGAFTVIVLILAYIVNTENQKQKLVLNREVLLTN